MLPAPKSSYAFADCLAPLGEYFLSEVGLSQIDSGTLVFIAKLNGPTGAQVWARAWVSNDVDGTLAETVSSQMMAGELMSVTVRLSGEKVPDRAYVRIESAPLHTEHVIGADLI